MLEGPLPDPPPKRKSGSDTRQRTATIVVRVTPEERQDIEQAASRAGLTIGSYARQKMLSGKPPRAVKRPALEREAAAKLLAALGKIGSNLNQIARSFNRGTNDHTDLADALSEAEKFKQVIRSMLGRHD